MLLGNGDGTFQGQQLFSIGNKPTALAAGDFNGDGQLDLAVAYSTVQGTLQNPTYPGPDGLMVLLGDGKGAFQIPPKSQVIPLVGNTTALVTGDFNGDGRLDLAAANGYAYYTGASSGPNPISPKTVSVLLGKGDGTFGNPDPLPVGDNPVALVAGDFYNDGHLDLAALDNSSSPPSANNSNGSGASIALLRGNGDGTFQPSKNVAGFPGSGLFAVGSDLVAADFNGDRNLDLATANYLSCDVSVLLGDGMGGFPSLTRYGTKGQPQQDLVAGDFNGDGNPDLAVPFFASNYYPATDNIAVLLGSKDGTFPNLGRKQSNLASPTGFPFVTGVFTGDGHTDFILPDGYSTGNLAVLLGNGDGTFAKPISLPVSGNLVDLAAGYFNADSNLDLAVATNQGILVLLGNGNGTFVQNQSIALKNLSNLAIGDFTGDHKQDIAFSYYDSYNKSKEGIGVLLGNGDGTFSTTPVLFPVSGVPQQLVAGEFDGDQRIDLASISYTKTSNPDGSSSYTTKVQILLSTGTGSTWTLQPKPPITLKGRASNFVVGQFTGDSHVDLAAITSYYPSSSSPPIANLTVLLGKGDGTFQDPKMTAVDSSAAVSNLALGDFTGHNNLDLAYVSRPLSFGSAAIAVQAGNGDGTFQPAILTPTARNVVFLVPGQFNGDHHLDLASVGGYAKDTSTYLGDGKGGFVPAVPVGAVPSSTPQVADLTGSGASDVAILDQNGNILFRRGIIGNPGVFEPPIVVNPGNPARDLAVVTNPGGESELAALDVKDSLISLYQFNKASGTFTYTKGPKVPDNFPNLIASADLNNDGLGDLVVTAADSNQVFVFLRNKDGSFSPEQPVSVGVNPSAIALVNVYNDQFKDIVVTNQDSGDVSVLLNQGNGQFVMDERFRAGTGVYGLTSSNDPTAVPAVLSTAATIAVAADSPSGGRVPYLVAINGGDQSASVLVNTGAGGFYNPQSDLTFPVGLNATAAVMGYFEKDNPNPDLAVLDQATGFIDIFSGNGSGHFTPLDSVPAGNAPTGLAVADVTGPNGKPDGIPDLLVGNAYGDVMILMGNGYGTLAPFQRIDQTVSLAVGSPNSKGQSQIIFSNKSQDQLAAGSAPIGAKVVAAAGQLPTDSNPVLAPGKSLYVDFHNGDPSPDLVVANTGANDVLVYRSQADGSLAPPVSFFAGTNPVGVTVANLNGFPDLVVANEGSNDVSVLLGNGKTGDQWSLNYGPRLRTAPVGSDLGLGPTSVAVADVTGPNGKPDGILDLIVSNSQSNTVSVLPGVGGGFFNDTNGLQIIPIPAVAPQQVFVGDFTGPGHIDLVTIDIGTNNITLIPNFETPGSVPINISSGGTIPVAAVAGDFTGDGSTDLLVANNGDGIVSLLLGGPDGLVPEAIFTNPELPHPSDIALSTVTGNTLNFFVSEQGKDLAFGFGINFSGPFSKEQLVDLVALNHEPQVFLPVLLNSGPVNLTVPEAKDAVSSSPGIFFNPGEPLGGLSSGAGTQSSGAAGSIMIKKVNDIVNWFQENFPSALETVQTYLAEAASGPGEGLDAALAALDQALHSLGLGEVSVADPHLQPMFANLGHDVLDAVQASIQEISARMRLKLLAKPEVVPAPPKLKDNQQSSRLDGGLDWTPEEQQGHSEMGQGSSLGEPECWKKPALLVRVLLAAPFPEFADRAIPESDGEKEQVAGLALAAAWFLHPGWRKDVRSEVSHESRKSERSQARRRS